MSTSLLYHGLGIQGYRYRSTEYLPAEIVFTVDQDRKFWRCSACGAANVRPKGRNLREFRAPPLGGKDVTIRFAVPRVHCRECGALRQVKVAFADERLRYTRAFARFALRLCRLMTIKDVAMFLHVSWDVIKGIHKRDLQRRFSRPKLGHLRKIAIDEISVAKGRRFWTLVPDLEC